MERVVMDGLHILARVRDSKRKAMNLAFEYSLAFFAWIVITAVVMMIGYIIVRGSSAMNWQFLSTSPTDNMSAGGIWPMIRGSLILLVGTFVISLPIGVLAGIFLAEYAATNKFVGFIRSCVASLAGTPSIIFALFGFAVFIIMPGTKPNTIAGWLTLSVMALPIIVLSTEQAVLSVPESLKEAAEAMGLTRAQAMFKVVLPSALPGIMTGTVLATGRSAGEAPPIFLTAGIYYTTANFSYTIEGLKEPVMNLPYHLTEGYRQGGKIPESIIWGTCLTLMTMVLCTNLAAILVRNQSRKKASH